MSNNRLVGTDRSLELLCLRDVQLKVGLEIVSLVVFLDRVGKGPFTPDIRARHLATGISHKRNDFLDGLGTLLFASIVTENPD